MTAIIIDPCAANQPRAPNGRPVLASEISAVGSIRCASLNKRVVYSILFLAFAAHCSAEEASVDNQLSPSEEKQGWILLFDGNTYQGWTTSNLTPSKRPLDAGAINPHRCGAYMVIHEKKWTDFVLKLDFRQSPGCNSGVFFRVHSLEPQPGKDVGYNGLEVAIDDTTTAGYHDAGAIYDLAKPIRNTLKPVGQWNHLVLTCSGNKVIVVLNGEAVNAVDLADFKEAGVRPDGTRHKFGVSYHDHPRTGFIGLQDHGSDIWFKNIKILPLED